MSSFDHVFPLPPGVSAVQRGVCTGPVMEFHISRSVRDMCQFDDSLFASTGNVILANFRAVRLFTQKINNTIDPVLHPEQKIKAGQLNAMGLIDEIFHYVCALYRKEKKESVFTDALARLEEKLGADAVTKMLRAFVEEFPPVAVYRGETDADAYLAGSTGGYPNRASCLEELMLLRLANENPAFEPFFILFDDSKLKKNRTYDKAWTELKSFFREQPFFGPENTDLVSMLKKPVEHSPLSLKGQLDYIRTHWAMFLGERLMRLLSGIDMIQEEEKPGWSGHFSGPPPMEAYSYDSLMKEYERFSPDRDWMPRVVLMAKTILVWLSQLSEKYGRSITRLDQIPDEELDILAAEGFTGLWLIGLWERSYASKRIKQINGNPEAAASAYSLDDYEISHELGGWEALDNLRRRLWYRGIRVAADMVPNHTGMDSKWVIERPDLFMQTRECPFPSYTFNGENLSRDPRVGVYLEDKYYSKSDCAVVFKRVDNYTGDTRYIYHGNDGTGMPWNDTAQIDFLNPAAREEVIQKILHVARNFPIIRFDAAMVLAKKHIRRLWYPEPGHGGDIPSRAEYAMSNEEFERRIPQEFWREVVDRCAQELPDTLLLAEAFWMMEGYFVRTLGMHRVYNSAFMNMLKREENEKYRWTIKNTLEFDPQVLKRFVNFMNNPDEETAVAQFGRGDKYFGVCTMMVTMPGLPMFGHGQIEGFEEKYGMEFTKAYWKETPDAALVERHRKEIFPLMKKRYLFSEIEHFYLYDLWQDGHVNENVFAYSNRFRHERTVVLYNNVYQQAYGWIKTSCQYAVKTGAESKRMEQKNIADALALSNGENSFCIFQEHRSGLWYIRSCRELRENGLYVRLNGFESQVLLNIREVHDDKTGRYRILYESLGGGGTHDIETAMQEIFLKELYDALMDFASPEFFTAAAQLLTPSNRADSDKKKKTRTLKDVLKNTENAACSYFDTLARFIAGNYGSDTVYNPVTAGPRVPTEEAWKRFAIRMERLVKIKETAENPAGDIPEATAAAAKKLYSWILEWPFMPELLTGYIILYSLRDVIGDRASAQDTASLINLWCLDRKIRDLMTEYGIPSKESFGAFKTMLTLLSFADCRAADGDCRSAAWTLVSSLAESESGQASMGVNLYDNVLWFNREKTDDTLRFGALLYAVQGTPSAPAKKTGAAKAAFVPRRFSQTQWNSEIASIGCIWDIIEKAKDEAEYKMDRFVGLLQPPAAEKPPAKPKRAPAKKTQGADSGKKRNP